MSIDAWFPIGFGFPDSTKAKLVVREGSNWQIFNTEPKSKSLIVKEELAEKWLNKGLLDARMLQKFSFGNDVYSQLSGGNNNALELISECQPPNNRVEAIAFAEAFKASRAIDKDSSFQDAIYVERFSRILPTYSLSGHVNDDVIFGYWLTGGIPVSINSTRRFRSLTGWLSDDQLKDIIEKSGLKVSNKSSPNNSAAQGKEAFTLAGRPDLERFLIEHVIDIVENEKRYKALGIEFPSAIILHGPPGCGKTFAIEKLVEYLEWPSYSIDASSIGSPYIHETSRKIAAIFDTAIENAPSVIVIDEMDAFLTDRQISAGSGQHGVEEIAEFLRRIPEAAKKKVLVVGMTNRIEMIDPAILRRGRFDHVVKVDMASESEIDALLKKLLSRLPQDSDIDVKPLAQKLQGRPLSDVAFIVREGARLAARSGQDKINQACLLAALAASPSREEVDPPRKIGFAT